MNIRSKCSRDEEVMLSRTAEEFKKWRERPDKSRRIPDELWVFLNI
jgi:hypothetical protein